MNYQLIYDQIINTAKQQIRDKKISYFEKHHIIPYCISADDSNTNLVLLTAREHFICHQLLIKIYPENTKLHYAFWLMCIYTSSNQKRIKPTSRTFDTIKSKIQIIQREKRITYNKNNPRNGSLNGMFGSCRTGTENPFFGKTHSNETKRIIGLKNKEHIWTDAEKQRLKDSWKGRPTIICPHCNKESIHASNMRRYHFDNCKSQINDKSGVLIF
jgi:hypothetical protein